MRLGHLVGPGHLVSRPFLLFQVEDVSFTGKPLKALRSDDALMRCNWKETHTR